MSSRRFAISTLVLAMVLAGCVAGPPVATPRPAKSSPLVETPYSYRECYPPVPPPSPFAHLSAEATIGHIDSRYPEQRMPLDLSTYQFDDPNTYSSGDWTLDIMCEVTELSWALCRVIVSNEATGFRWEGDVQASRDLDETLCDWTEAKVDGVRQESVRLPHAPTPTPIPPTPTTTAAAWPRIFAGDVVPSVAFSPDGKTLGVGVRGIAGTIVLWDVNKHIPIGQPLKGHTNALASIAFSPDGKTLASGGWDYTITLWDVGARRPIGQPLNEHQSSVRSVTFSPDGKMLASGSEDNTIILWDVSDVTRPRRIGQPLTGQVRIVMTVAFSPDGRTLASGNWDKTVVLWDVSNPSSPAQLGSPLRGLRMPVESVAFSPDGKILAATDGNDVALWDVSDTATPRAIGRLIGHASYVETIAFSPDGQTLASGSADKTIILWDVASRLPFGLPLTGHTGSVESVAFSPNGETLASGSWDQTVILWDVSDPRSPAQVLWDVSTPAGVTPTTSP